MTFAREMRALARLAWPVVATQVGMMAFGIVDTKMVGLLGARELAAVGLVDAVLFGTLIGGIGLVMGIDPIVAQAHGAGNDRAASRGLQEGTLLALAATVPLTIVWLNAGTILVWLGQDATLAEIGGRYAAAQAWSIAPFLVFTALRQYLQARGRVIAPLVVIAAANVANVGLNWALIFGRLGMPALGVSGAAIATGTTRTLVAIGLAVHMLRRGDLRFAWGRGAFRELGAVTRHGLHISLQLSDEVWLACAVEVVRPCLHARAHDRLAVVDERAHRAEQHAGLRRHAPKRVVVVDGGLHDADLAARTAQREQPVAQGV
jgi:MATE family multidrug resistance protein